MADIHLRFHKDILVLSSPINTALMRQGLDVKQDLEYAIMFEPETLEEAYNTEQLMGAQCLVADTGALTPARMAHTRFANDAQGVCDAAMRILSDLAPNVPQHVLVELNPCGLPIDATSKNSLVENRDQYKRAAKLFENATFDAFFLNGFNKVVDLKCALMGIRMISDKPIFASVDIDADGNLCERPLAGTTVASDRKNSTTGEPSSPKNTEQFAQAVEVMAEYGADVVGFSAEPNAETMQTFVQTIRKTTQLPILSQIYVVNSPSEEDAEKLMDLADTLCNDGVQFLRAVGNATPAYTGTLVAATDRLEVKRASGLDSEQLQEKADIDKIAAQFKDKISAALKKNQNE